MFMFQTKAMKKRGNDFMSKHTKCLKNAFQFEKSLKFNFKADLQISFFCKLIKRKYFALLPGFEACRKTQVTAGGISGCRGKLIDEP